MRKADGRDVAIMNLRRKSRERNILRHLEKAQNSSGVDQHIAPILETFEDDREPELEFFVMPLLRKYYRPGFEAISEVVDLFRQLLEVGDFSFLVLTKLNRLLRAWLLCTVSESLIGMMMLIRGANTQFTDGAHR